MRTYHVVLIMLSVVVYMGIVALISLFSKGTSIKRIAFGGTSA